jgi:hypothetical protein
MKKFATKSTLEGTYFEDLHQLAAEAIQFAYDCISTNDPGFTEPTEAGRHAAEIAAVFCKFQDKRRKQ